MTKIDSYKLKKAESIQSVQPISEAAAVGSAEGSLLEEFSQILDKIAQHLASGDKDTETMDLLAVEQAAERIQAGLSQQQSSRVESLDVEKGAEPLTTEDEKDGGSGERFALSTEDLGEENNSQDALEEQTAGDPELSDLTTGGAKKSDDSSKAQQSDRAVLESSAEQIDAAAVSENVAVEGDSQVLSSDKIALPEPTESSPFTPSVKVPQSDTIASPSSEAAKKAADSKVVIGSGETIASPASASPVVPGAEAQVNLSASPLSAEVIREVSARNDLSMKPTVNDKAIPFSAFMLQGAGSMGGGLARDVVAQSILRPSLELASGRQVGEVSSANRGGSSNGSFQGDAALLKNSSGGVKSDLPAREMKTLSRVMALRTLEKVERAMEEVARSKDGKTITLHLEPVTLGKVKVDVSLREGNLHARLSAEAVEVQHLLREHAHELQSILRKMGLNVDSVAVSVSAEGTMFESNAELFDQQQFSRGSGESRDNEVVIPVDASIESTVQKAVVEDHWVA